MKYVSYIQGGELRTSESSAGPFHYSSEGELLQLVGRLIDEGFAFVDEPAGWPPAEVLRELNTRGVFDRSFTAVTWSGPGHFRTYPGLDANHQFQRTPSAPLN